MARLAPFALGAAAVFWLLVGCFHVYFSPGHALEDSFDADFDLDPIPADQAQAAPDAVLVVFGLCALAAALHVAIARWHRASRGARWAGAVIGGCYVALAMVCAAAWAGDRGAPGLLVYAAAGAAFGIPMLAGLAGPGTDDTLRA